MALYKCPNPHCPMLTRGTGEPFTYDEPEKCVMCNKELVKNDKQSNEENNT